MPAGAGQHRRSPATARRGAGGGRASADRRGGAGGRGRGSPASRCAWACRCRVRRCVRLARVEVGASAPGAWRGRMLRAFLARRAARAVRRWPRPAATACPTGLRPAAVARAAGPGSMLAAGLRPAACVRGGDGRGLRVPGRRCPASRSGWRRARRRIRRRRRATTPGRRAGRRRRRRSSAGR